MTNKKCWPNGILLTLPPLFYNLLLAGRLPAAFSPEIFDKGISPLVIYGENIFRAFVFIFPIFMLIQFQSRRQRTGLAFYLTGIALYFGCWLPLIFAPESGWSLSLVGFLAPAYTPLIWLTGLALIGDQICLNISYRWWTYLIGVLIFLTFHSTHVYLVFTQNL